MNVSSLSKDSTKSCANCGKEFQYVRATAQYCGGTCRLQARRESQKAPSKPKRRKTQLEHLSGSLFGKYIISNVKHSGTVQIIPSNSTVETFMELLELFKDRMYANGTGSYRLSYPDNFELCHLSPAKGKDGSRGLLIPANLVVAPALINRTLGNKPTAYSKNPALSIPRSKLLPQWKVKEGDSDVKILKLINKYTGGSLEQFQKTKKLKAYVSKETNFEGLKPQGEFLVHFKAIEHISKHHGLPLFSKISFEDLLTGNFKATPLTDTPVSFEETCNIAANDDEGYWFDFDKTFYSIGGFNYVVTGDAA